MPDITVANEIFKQLGGNRFAVMTGSKKFIADGNTLRMALARNKSGANILNITLTDDDFYTMQFLKFTDGRLDRKTLKWIDAKIEEVETFEGLYYDQLRDIFTHVTGMFTSLSG